MTIRSLTNYHYVNAYLKSIDGWFIAGGSVLSMIQDIPHGDHDVFFENEESFKKATELMNHIAITYETDNAITYANNIQLIHRNFGSVEDILSDFDLNIVKVAYHPQRGIFDLRGDVSDRIIKIINPKYYSIFHRVRKYVQRGYTIDLDGVLYLKQLMLSDSLSVSDLYGGAVWGKFSDIGEFKERSSWILHYCDPKIYFEVTKEYDYMQDLHMQMQWNSSDKVLGYDLDYQSERNLNYAVTQEQRWAILYGIGELIGNEYEMALEQYPEYFI